jgi:hypothetical protein
MRLSMCSFTSRQHDLSLEMYAKYPVGIFRFGDAGEGLFFWNYSPKR